MDKIKVKADILHATVTILFPNRYNCGDKNLFNSTCKKGDKMLEMLLAEKIKPVVNVGNIMFYFIIAGLVIAVAVIIVLFTKSERYKIKVREAYMEKNKEYQAPLVIKVFKDENKDQIATAQESLNKSEPTKSKEAVDEKADKK